MEVVYFASLRLFRHSRIQQSRLVGKSPSPDSPFVATLPQGVAQVAERSSSSRFRGKLRGINGSSAARTKTGRSVRARASATPALFLPHARLFGRLGEARRGETAKIYHPKLVSSAFSSSSTGELLGHLVFAPANYRVAILALDQSPPKLKVNKK